MTKEQEAVAEEMYVLLAGLLPMALQYMEKVSADKFFVDLLKTDGEQVMERAAKAFGWDQ